jgi:guanine nucleotide-binding protein G(i) subunit alpha
VASLSEYDQILFEDDEKNRMQESLELFETIVSQPEFDGKPIFLLLTKRDVLEIKLKVSPLSKLFPEFSGGSQLASAIEFITEEFLKRAPTGVRERILEFDLNAFSKDEVGRVCKSIQEHLCSTLEV